MKTKNIILALIAIALAAIIITRAVRPNNSSSIRVAGIFSLTGNAAVYGEPAKNGMMLAIEDINAKGGINGKLVEAVYEDSQFDPKIAISAYQKARAEGIRLIVSNGSSVSLALQKPVVDNKDLQFETGAVTPAYSDGVPNTCRLTLTAPVAGKRLGDFIAEKMKPQSFAALTINDDFGRSMAENVSKTVSGYGIAVKGAESFDKSAGDFRTQITKLAAMKPDVLMVIPLGGQAPALLKQLKELNWKGTMVSDHWTIINDSIKDLSLVEGIYFVNYDWDGLSWPAYMDRFKTSAPAIAANAYDSMQLIAYGIKGAGTEDPESLAKWLIENTEDYQGITGSITLNPDCEASRSAVIQQVKDGKFVTVE